MNLLAIDPGKHVSGMAVFTNGRLTWAGLCETQHIDSFEIPTELIIECPQIYRRSKGDPNDLVDVALTVGRFLNAMHYASITVVKPREWKGNVPKKIMLNRIWKRMSPKEHQIFRHGKIVQSLQHNVIDAIGIGLWKLKRL
jgi:hypothetical protein